MNSWGSIWRTFAHHCSRTSHMVKPKSSGTIPLTNHYIVGSMWRLEPIINTQLGVVYCHVYHILNYDIWLSQKYHMFCWFGPTWLRLNCMDAVLMAFASIGVTSKSSMVCGLIQYIHPWSCRSWRSNEWCLWNKSLWLMDVPDVAGSIQLWPFMSHKWL